MTGNTQNNSEWIDRDFSYWKPEFMPTPREAMADLKANKTESYKAIITKYCGNNPKLLHDVEWALDSLIIESGDLELQQRYKWLGFRSEVSKDGRIAIEIT